MRKCKTKHPLYWLWSNMVKRCESASATGFARYGARGIQVCVRWRRNFWAFVDDVGDRPSSEHSLDRYPNRKGDYEPGNVRWVTAKEQAHNRCDNKLTACKVQKIRSLVASGVTQVAVAKRFKISKSMVNKVVHNHRWKE